MRPEQVADPGTLLRRQQEIMRGYPAYILHPAIDLKTIEVIGGGMFPSQLYWYYVLSYCYNHSSVNNMMGAAFTPLGSMDHMRAIKNAHPDAEITYEHVESYLNIVHPNPSKLLKTTYVSILNHPFISVLMALCESAEYSDFPSPIATLNKTAGKNIETCMLY